MKILITNDDGVFAPGIVPLVEYAKKMGEVTVVAPKVEQSGKSHALDFTHPLEIKQLDLFSGVRTFSVDSTPADCVRFAICGLKEKFDLVLSGINRGVNLGADLVYSGTVGAIFEAARLGVPGIALSTYPNTLDGAVKLLDKVFDFVKENDLLSVNPLYNININTEAKGILITRQGTPYFSDDFELVEKDTYIQTGHIIPDECPDDLTRDTVATEKGYITVTPLNCSRTNLSVFEKLSSLYN